MNNSSSKRSRAVFQLDAASALTLNTITLMTFMAASSAPTPLYRLYQQLWQFSPVTLTLIFATYAFTLLGSLLIIGSLSDYIGRRPVIIAAISLQIIWHCCKVSDEAAFCLIQRPYISKTLLT
ncbi:hypothetical protein ACORNY_14920, partial [Acinetobacter baumannii]